MAGKYITRAAQIGEDYGEAELLSYMNRLMEAESEVASLQYRLYEMHESNQHWSHSAAALERENHALQSLAEQLRAENEQIRASDLDLPEQIEAENKNFAARESPQVNEKPTAWRKWLQRFFGGKW